MHRPKFPIVKNGLPEVLGAIAVSRKGVQLIKYSANLSGVLPVSGLSADFDILGEF